MLFLVAKGQGSANFAQRDLACAEHAAGTLSPVGVDTVLFRFLFISCSAIPPDFYRDLQACPSYTSNIGKAHQEN